MKIIKSAAKNHSTKSDALSSHNHINLTTDKNERNKIFAI